jgi:glycolate oxidase
VRLGGVVSGEHGIGVEKRDYMDILFTTADLAAMARLRRSFDPRELFNPGKVFPARKGCGELAKLRQHAIAANEIGEVPAGTWL